MRGGFISWLWGIDTRSAEVLIGLVLIGRGLTLIAPGVSLTEPVYTGHLKIASEGVWGVVYLMAGAFIWAGLVINGRWRQSPMLRLSGAVVALVSNLALSFTFYGNSSVIPSLAGGVYACLALASLWVLIRVEQYL